MPPSPFDNWQIGIFCLLLRIKVHHHLVSVNFTDTQIFLIGHALRINANKDVDIVFSDFPFGITIMGVLDVLGIAVSFNISFIQNGHGHLLQSLWLNR